MPVARSLFRRREVGDRVSAERYLGLDLSLSGTGIVILDAAGAIRNQSLVGHKLTRKATVREKLERMIGIASFILDKIRAEDRDSESDHPLEWVAGVEHYAFSAHGAFADLGEVNGVVKTQLWLAFGLEPQQVIASSARKLVLGKGNTKKADVMPALAKRGVKFDDHNVADAYVIAEALRLTTRSEKNGTDKD